ncbi:MAG: GNAT family N-acetyltransferase [Pyrinomonadaceae bacterium]|nr:GNAT family N-acetyltransferase [Pyrinomonadaceae bacterium]
MPDVNICSIIAAETRTLRGAVLRPGHPLESSVYPGDDDLESRHFGAYLNGELIGVASVFRQPLPGESDANSWRLRGMAVKPESRGQGHGRALLERCIDHVTEQGGTLFWCNGRAHVVGFYRAFGFEPLGDEFDIPDSGPHFVMRLRINRQASSPQARSGQDSCR